MKQPSAKIALARQLRASSTDVERKLWARLRAGQLGVKFRRQAPIGGLVADFLCIEARLIIELDGGQHARNAADDDRRTSLIENGGWLVLRFWNNEVVENLDGVLAEIQRIIGRQSPLPEGERVG